ncbi:carbon-nitrogen hydrolase family protein [candidate division KSB1 bacterium]|nr:carbon-nitrogen hydrolase family protein [candidate division KSB1 bacterium]
MKFNLACVQFRSRLGEIDYNLAQMAEWCARAAARNIAVVVFPEACLTGYCRPRQMAELAQPFADELQMRVAKIARANNVLFTFGMPEREGDATYNSMIAIDANGEILGRYRKMHLWAAESKWAKAGDEYVTFKAELAHFGMWLCYDTRFPEVARVHALRGVEVALVASAWRSSHVEEWRLCARARAIDNGIFIAGSDAVLAADHFSCAGGSIIAGPDGSVLALAAKGQEGMIVAEIDTVALYERRKDLPLLQQRRPELYGEVSDGFQYFSI